MRMFSVFWTNGVRASGFRLWWTLIPILTAGNQICTKLLAQRLLNVPFGLAWLAHAIPTPWFGGIILCQLASLVLWLKILSTVKISTALPLTASAYILVILLSVSIFHEKIVVPEIGAALLILLGIGLIASEKATA